MKKIISTDKLADIIEDTYILVSQMNDASCCVLKYATYKWSEQHNIDMPGSHMLYSTLLEKYRTVTGARILTCGFRIYPHDYWCSLDSIPRRAIRLYALRTFKQHIIDSQLTIELEL